MVASRSPGARIRRLSSAEIGSYDVVSADLAIRVKLMRMPFLLGPYQGMTVGRYVVLTRNVRPDGWSPLLAHELVHVTQWAELGVVGFLARYLWSFATGLWRHRSWQAAYRNIGLEQDARRGAEAWAQRRANH